MHRQNTTILALALTSIISGTITPRSLQADDHEVDEDPQGDALIRRTDLYNDGLMNNESNLPDLIRTEIGGWESRNPATNPFQGEWDDAEDTGLWRFNIVFAGLINPPGPIGLYSPDYDPYRYGPSPLYGFVEFDIDEEIDTGGEVDNITNRFLGNVSRFGGRVEDDLGQRAAISALDFDQDLLTEPLVERSGEEWHLSLCGCDPLSVVTNFNDPTPDTFDAGYKSVLAARFLHRTHAFTQYAFSFGGSRAGEYDPEILLLFEHHQNTNETIVSLVYAINQDGAGRLAGMPAEPLDLNAANQTSIHEIANEIRFTALNAFDPGLGTPFDLLRAWNDEDHDELEEYLEPEEWEINALFGTAYAEPQDDAHYIWTDVAFDFTTGDMDGDDAADDEDQDWISDYILKNDGQDSNIDQDQVINGQITIPFFGNNFFIGDLNYDGVVNAFDFNLISKTRPGDVNADLEVNFLDLIMLQQQRGLKEGDLRFNPVGDLNRNGRIDNHDLSTLRKIIRLATIQAAG